MTLSRREKALRILVKINKECDKLKKLDYCFTDVASSIVLVDNKLFKDQVDNNDAFIGVLRDY